MSWHYILFGLVFESEIELPELIAADAGRSVDVFIRLGPLEDGLPSKPGLHPVAPGRALLCIGEAGRYLCVDGQAICVEPQPGVPVRNLRLFLLGSAMGLLLHQRGLLPIHANAVEIDGKAYAFMGPSGSGKSTLAVWFQDHGYRLYCDDVCVVSFDETGGPLAWPGLPRLRLWRDVLDRTGRDAAQFQRSFQDDDDWEKYDVPAMAVAAEPIALGGLYLLERADEREFELLGGVIAMDAVFANIYRGEFLSAGELERQWQTCLHLVATVPVQRWRRRWGHEQCDEEIRALLDQITGKIP